jgi:hypothetical protein
VASLNFRFAGGAGDDIGDTVFASQFGAGGTLPRGQFVMPNGTGTGQIDRIAVVTFSVSAGGTVTYDLRSGMTDVLNRSLVLAKLKFVYMELDAAVTGNVWFGPQNQSNGIELWFDGKGATARERVLHRMLHDNPAGWTVDSTNKVVAIVNGTGATVAGKLVLGGNA